MSPCNDGRAPTFVRGTSESHIDIMFASVTVRRSVSDWRVRDDESLSLHKYISFDLESGIQNSQTPQNHGWATKKIDKHLLSVALAARPYVPTPRSTIDEEADQLVGWITLAADGCEPKRQLPTSRRPVHWWNSDIGELRKKCLCTRRIFQRKRKRYGDADSQVHEARWNELRKSLSTAIKIAKEKAWSDLIEMVDKDPWGKPYKVVVKRLRSARPIPGIDLPGRLESIVNQLFPTVPARLTSPANGPAGDLTTVSEVVAAARSLPNQKAHGPDGITNEMLKVTVSCKPNFFQRAFNRCLTEGQFPTSCKVVSGESSY